MNNSIIKFKYSIIAILMIVLHGVVAHATTPWVVNPGDYRYDMSLYLDVILYGTRMDYSKYNVAVFSGDQCRGVAEILSLENGKECLYLRTRSNQESDEALTFKYCNKETGEILPVYGVSFPFEAESRLGYPSDPYMVDIIRHFAVNLNAGNGGSIDQTGGMIAEATELTITAKPSEGYHFKQWSDGNTDNPRNIVIENDITLTAEFDANTYKLIYNVDNSLYKEYDVSFGTSITPETAPEKEGYSFSGWKDLPETMPARDVTVTGSFSINSYNAVFKIGEDVIETKTVVFGQPVVAPNAPEKEGHTFAGWQNIPETMPAHDIEILGSYTVNSYKLTYLLDGETYKVVEIKFGSPIVAEVAPEKEGYTFSGWKDLPETMPARDVTVTGSFSINSYNAVFKIGEEVIETKTVVFGQPVVAPDAPEKEGHTFAGWQNIPETMPAHDIEILGSYTVNSYKLTYLLDGETYKVVEIKFGSPIVAEVAPEKEGYTFSGWKDLPETMPARDVTVTGSFSINSYNAVFKIGEEVIETKTVVFGQPVVAPDAPEKEGHTFAGWQNIPETMPAHDIEILGSYTVNSYKLTYLLDGETYKVTEIEFGSPIVAEVAPEKEGYTFSGWDGLPETMPARDVTVTGSFSINSYKLSVYLDNEIYLENILEYGSEINIPEPELPTGRKFNGWNTEIPATMPAHDLEIFGTTTDTSSLPDIFPDGNEMVTIYDIKGHLIFSNIPAEEAINRLRTGIYIINGKKVFFK